MRAVDATGAEGLFTTTINIDNDAPELVVDSPADGEVVSDTAAPGRQRSMDTIGARLARGEHRSHLGGPRSGGRGREEHGGCADAGRASSRRSRRRGLAPGWYNVQLEAADRAGNRSYVSRNFLKRAGQEAERVELLFPPAASGSPVPSR